MAHDKPQDDEGRPPGPGEKLNSGDGEAGAAGGLRDGPARQRRRSRGAAGGAQPRVALHGRRLGVPGRGRARRRLRARRNGRSASSPRRRGSQSPTRTTLVPFSRWITPAEVEIRFDTWFFVVESPPDAEAVCDGEECVDVRWLTPRAALEAYARDELLLVFPTIKHLEQLAEFDSVEQALAHARTRRVQPVQPRVLVDGGVARVVLPGEPGYAD